MPGRFSGFRNVIYQMRPLPVGGTGLGAPFWAHALLDRPCAILEVGPHWKK